MLSKKGKNFENATSVMKHLKNIKIPGFAALFKGLNKRLIEYELEALAVERKEVLNQSDIVLEILLLSYNLHSS